MKHLVKLISEQGPEVTIIDGMSGRYAVRSPWYEPGHHYSYLDGFTMRNAEILIEDTERNHIYWWCDMEVHNSVLEGRIVNGQGWGTGIYKGPHARVVTTRTTFRDLGNGFSTFWGPVTTENVWNCCESDEHYRHRLRMGGRSMGQLRMGDPQRVTQ